MRLLRKRYWQYIIILLLISPTHLLAQKDDALNVLFVGNSFTYFFNLPQVVSAMAESKGFTINTRQSTVGGSNLEQHWKSEKGTLTRSILLEEKWDYVVFNNHSLSPIATPESFHEYGTKFAELVKSLGAEPVFMMTWAYKSNPAMQAGLTNGYYELSQNTGSAFVPAGPIFAEVRNLKPKLELFHDDKHPSAEGTYLIGLAFYKYFTKAPAKGIPNRLLTKDIHGEKLYLMFMSQQNADFFQGVVDDFEFEPESSND